MQMWVMSPLLTKHGFTLIELLVTLTILGLSSSLVAPAVMTWLDSREAAAKRTTLANTLAMLPMEASRSGKRIIIENAADLRIDDDSGITIKKKIIVLENGYCNGGRIVLSLPPRVYTYSVTQPFCEVVLDPS